MGAQESRGSGKQQRPAIGKGFSATSGIACQKLVDGTVIIMAGLTQAGMAVIVDASAQRPGRGAVLPCGYRRRDHLYDKDIRYSELRAG